MAIFQQKSNDDWRQKRSQEQIAKGGLPLNAQWRLKRLVEGGRLFTSELSVNELALLGPLGVRPLGQVTGSSVYHVGRQQMPVWRSGELDVQSQAHSKARQLTLLRLQTEAQMLRAHGVIDVRLDVKTSPGIEALIEVTATGTAVAWHGAHTPGLPLLCALSGQELCALYAAGYFPVGLAIGGSVYYQIGSQDTYRATQNGVFSSAARQNQELSDYTQGLSRARRHAVRRLEESAAWLHAEGIVGTQYEKTLHIHDAEVEINEKKVKRRDLIAQFFILGTAIRQVTDGQLAVRAVMPLES